MRRGVSRRPSTWTRIWRDSGMLVSKSVDYEQIRREIERAKWLWENYSKLLKIIESGELLKEYAMLLERMFSKEGAR